MFKFTFPNKTLAILGTILAVEFTGFGWYTIAALSAGCAVWCIIDAVTDQRLDIRHTTNIEQQDAAHG